VLSFTNFNFSGNIAGKQMYEQEKISAFAEKYEIKCGEFIVINSYAQGGGVYRGPMHCLVHSVIDYS
jgi:hypothetical protein